jgi:hypothetical protein
MKTISRQEFLVNRDETGREVVFYPETGKQYFIEYLKPRGWRSSWGDVDPATKTLQSSSYGSKFKGTIEYGESLITKENGFEEIIEGKGSPYHTINMMHEKWKKENGYV